MPPTEPVAPGPPRPAKMTLLRIVSAPLFAATYTVLSGSEQEAFTEPLDRFDSLYFVVTVFATVGFGDISPVSTVARMLVTVQMVADLILIGLVLRLFLTAVDRGRRRAAPHTEAPSLDLG